MATFAQRIADYTGDYTGDTNPNGLEEVVSATMAEVMNALPSELTVPLCESGDIVNITSATTALVDNDIVLSVYYADDGVEATKVSNPIFNKASDSGSIYEASQLDPVYTISNNASGVPELRVHPAPTNGEAYTFPQQSVTITNSFSNHAGIPQVAHELIILGASIKVLQSRISDAVQTEEDPELTRMAIEQINSLKELYQFEMAKLLGAPEGA